MNVALRDAIWFIVGNRTGHKLKWILQWKNIIEVEKKLFLEGRLRVFQKFVYEICDLL